MLNLRIDARFNRVQAPMKACRIAGQEEAYGRLSTSEMQAAGGSDDGGRMSLRLAVLFGLSCVLAGLTLSSGAFAQGPGAEIESIRSADLSGADALIAAIGRDIPELRPEVARATTADVVIFIPGILGSKLTDPVSGRIIWGNIDLPILLSDLVLSQNAAPARAEILEHFKVDVYGEMRDELSGVLGDEQRMLWFPYDWRYDLKVIASRFDQQVRTTWAAALKGRRVTIIAHSMGGLVSWAWKNLYYARRMREYDFHISQLVLLGAPLDGSCEALRMLLAGYRPPIDEKLKVPKVEVPVPASHWVLELYYEKLFGALHPAAFTFPSIFQLLPREQLQPNRRTSCLVVSMPQSGDTPQGHFGSWLWERMLLRPLEGSGKLAWLFQWLPGVSYRKAVWEELGMSRNEFVEHLKRMLTLGQTFRDSLELSEAPLESRVTYFYNTSYHTVFQVRVRDGSVDGASDTDGDGRVLEESATNGARYFLTPRRLSSPHDGLVRDGDFIEWLRKDFRRNVRAERVKDGLLALMTNAAGRRALLSYRTVIGLSDLGVDPLAKVKDDRATAIIGLNLDVLREVAGVETSTREDLALSAYRAAAYFHKGRAEIDVAIPFYETALGTGELAQRERNGAVTNYAAALLEQGKHRQAKNVIDESLSELSGDLELQPYVLNNLGVAYQGLGKAEAARVLYEKAAELGLETARVNLQRLSGQLR